MRVCKQCGKEYDDEVRNGITGEILHRIVCVDCEHFNSIVDKAYEAEHRTDEQQYIVDKAIEVYKYQISLGHKPTGVLARIIRREARTTSFFDEYVAANTPHKEDTNNEDGEDA